MLLAKTDGGGGGDCCENINLEQVSALLGFAGSREGSAPAAWWAARPRDPTCITPGALCHHEGKTSATSSRSVLKYQHMQINAD